MTPVYGRHAPRFPTAQEQRVLDELTFDPQSLSMNELATRCDCSVSKIGMALIALEGQGRARFRCGRWSPSRRR
jgi:predicted Rossmann fold nucleotide-binding protein DprA/Smf involved in DNA uptake